MPTTPVTVSFGPGESIPAMFEVTIDPSAMSATSHPLIARTAAGFQASQFDLDITKFQKQAQFDVQSVQFTEIGDVEVTFRHAHPWGPVDIASPPSATNRADLGYTGRLLILADLAPADIPSHTFFTDVKANTELIRGADGYIQPGDLLAKSGFNANCFPYMLLADEAKDNRIGVSNGGIVTGNWDPAVGGWQRSNLGPNGDGWTGYDFVHAGQTIENSFVLNADELTGGPVTLQVALLIKYTEPKGVGGEVGRTLRLPPATVDVLQFAYRAPHAAIDGSRIQQYNWAQGSATEFVCLDESAGRSESVFMRVRDWDARNAETVGTDLAATSDVALIDEGTAGIPSLELSSPQVWSGSVLLTEEAEPPSWTGLPAAELRYRGTIVNEFGTPAISDHFAMVRVTDPAEGLPTGSPHLGLDPQTLAPDATRAVELVNYMGVRIRIAPDRPTWNNHSVDLSSNNGKYPSIAVLTNDLGDPTDDRLAIAYQDVTSKDVKVAIAQRIDPRASTDWLFHTVDASTDVGYGIKMVLHNDRLLMLYFDYGRDRISCAQSLTDLPVSMADWSITAATASSVGAGATELNLLDEAGDSLLLVFGRATDGIIMLGRCTIPQPVGASDWAVQPVASGIKHSDLRAVLHQGRLAMIVYVPSSLRARIAIAKNNAPYALNDWDIHDPAPPPPHWPDVITLGQIFSVNTRLMTNYNGSEFFLSKSNFPQSHEDWDVVRLPFGGTSSFHSYVVQNEALYLVSDRFTDLRVHRSMTDPPAKAWDWQVATILNTVDCCGSGNQDTAVAWFQDRLAVAHRGQGSNVHLQFAWNQDVW